MINRSTLLIFFALGFTLLFFATTVTADRSCSLSVESIPQGGAVFIDGTDYGIAPVSNISVACGLLTIEVQAEGYADYTSPVILDEGAHEDITASLERLPDRGQVNITSDPPGGDLFIDGRIRGKTPVVAGDLLPGRHEILLRKSGYEDYHDVISVVTDSVTSYAEYLVPLPGTGFLSITSLPEGADVRVDGTGFGQTPTNLQRVGAGNHSVEISKPGYWNFTGMVYSEGGKSLLAKAALYPIPTTSTLYLDSSPAGTGIFLNGTFKGFTPATLDAPEGDYQLEFRQPGGSSVNRSFHITAGATHEISIDFNNDTGRSIIDREWQYQNDTGLMNQPGWITVNQTPVIERNYTWISKGHEASITLDIPQDLYDYYKNQPHPTNVTPETFADYTLNANDRQYLHDLLEKLKDSSNFKSYSARNDYRNVVAFVQNIVYKEDTDPVTNQPTDYWQYPVETLALGTGDCEDTAILSAALLKEMGYDVVIVILPGNPGHAGAAIACANCNGYYYPLDGKRYYFLETTGTGFSPGSMDKKYETTMAQVIPL